MERNIVIEEESFVEILFKYIYIVLKHKKIVLITVIVTIPLVFSYLKLKEPEFIPEYKATARIRVMAEGITESDDDLKRVIYKRAEEIEGRVEDLVNLLRSTIVLEEAVKKAYGFKDKEQIAAFVKDLQEPDSERFVLESELNYINLTIIDADPSRAVALTGSIIEAARTELLNSKKLVAEEAIESLEKQFKEARHDLEQAKLKLTKFIVENEVLSEAIRTEGKNSVLIEDSAQLAFQLVEVRSMKTHTENFIKGIQGTREARGDIAAFGLILDTEEDLSNAKLLDDLSKQEKALSNLLLVNKEAHPDVVKARDRLNQTKLLISKEIDVAIDALKGKKEWYIDREKHLADLIEKGLSEVMIEYSQLQRNVQIKESLAQKVVDSLQELSLATKLIDAGTFTVVDPPVEPKQPYNLYEKGRASARYFLFSIIFGLGAGIGLTILIDYFGMAVKDIHEIEEALDYPILGEIPIHEKATKEEEYLLPLKDNPRSVVSEAIRGLRTNIKFRCVEKDIKTFLITSLVPEEGKTFICANLAVAFAQTDKKILIIDCDLRKSSMHKYFGLENEKGISQLIKGEEGIKPIDTKISNLSVLVAGKHPPSPAELLASDEFDKVLATLRQKYDMVIIDSPPLFAVTDSTILVKKLDATILTIRADVTPKKAVRRAAKLDKDIKSKIMGIVFNGIETRKGRYGSYYYYKYDYYGKKDEKKEKKT